MIRDTSRVDERDTVEFVVEGMVGATEDDAVHPLAEEIFRPLSVMRVLGDRADIVRDAHFVPIEVLNAHVRQRREIEVEIVATHGEHLSRLPAEGCQHLFAFEVSRVDDDVRALEMAKHRLWNGIFALPMRVGEDCNSHNPRTSLATADPIGGRIIPPAGKATRRCDILAGMDVLLIPRTGLRLKSPVIAASGTFGYGTEFARRNSLVGLGALVCKGTTRAPRTGNVPLRLAETPAGTLNSIGLQNIGVDAVIRDKAPVWSTWDVPVFVNVSASSIDEYVEVISLLDGVPGVAGVELNISCPNVKEGGIAFGTDVRMAAAVTRAARATTTLPLMVKLSPNVTDIRAVAQAVEGEGADALSLINTVYGMAIDRRRRSPLLASVYGGVSGPAIKPLALYQVFAVAETVSVPIVGLGGIMTAEDAIEFLLAGATAVGVATLLLLDPAGWRAVTSGIERWCEREGIATLDAIVGAANPRYARRAGEQGLTGS